MAVGDRTRAVLLAPKLLTGTASENVYDNAASTKVYYGAGFLHNQGAATYTVSIYLVPNNGGSLGTAGDTSNRMALLSIAPDETISITPFLDGIIQTAQHDSIQLKASTTSKVYCALYGITEVTA